MSETIQPQEIPAYTHMTGEIYDLLYSRKNYEREAAKVMEIIQARGESGGNDMLEAACGTGRYIQHFNQHFNVDGFDLSAEQVQEAQKKFPDNHLFQADMLTFESEKPYDVVLCLFSSIGYVQTKEGLDKAVANMAKATKPGGLVIVEPWLPAHMFKPGHVSVETEQNEDLTVSRMGVSSQEGNLSVLSMHHMVGTSQGVEHFLEVHKLAIHSDDDFTDAFTKAGLEIEIDPEGLTNRRLCIGKKPL